MIVMNARQPNELIQPNPQLNLDSLKNSFNQLRQAYEADRMPNADVRRARLDKLANLLRDNTDLFAAAISADFSHRSPHETKLLEIFPAMSAIKHATSHLRVWMRAKRSWASLTFLPARIELRPQPLGVVGIIVPWNYPLFLAVTPLVAALAAGNRAYIKMSEFTPQTGALFARLIHAAFTDNEVLVLNGEADVAAAFAALPFDHLLFTGSTSVGRHVMRAAADNLTPVTLELGGKSPAIIGREADIDKAASKIMFGKCLNAGQTCIAPDYVLLPRGKEAAFIAAAKLIIEKQYPAIATNPDYSAIINQRHMTRLKSYLDEAREGGAIVTPLADCDLSTQKIAPTIVTNAKAASSLMCEEIFGPLLPLVTYDNIDEAIDYVNARARPLALYYFGHDRNEQESILNRTVAGGVSVNETIMHVSQEALPFGGVGPSGMGAYHGKYGFDTFSKLKPIFHQSRFNSLFLLKPPYGKRIDALLKILMK